MVVVSNCGASFQRKALTSCGVDIETAVKSMLPPLEAVNSINAYYRAKKNNLPQYHIYHIENIRHIGWVYPMPTYLLHVGYHTTRIKTA